MDKCSSRVLEAFRKVRTAVALRRVAMEQLKRRMVSCADTFKNQSTSGSTCMSCEMSSVVRRASEPRVVSGRRPPGLRGSHSAASKRSVRRRGKACRSTVNPVNDITRHWLSDRV